MSSLTQEDDKERFKDLGMEKLIELFMNNIKTVWRVDGLYFQGIEKRFGQEAAREIDRESWESIARMEAKDLKKIFRYDGSTEDFTNMLLNTSWALYQEEKKVIEKEDEVEFYVVRCRVQEARIKKGLGVFPCKEVRYSYLKAFSDELDKNVEAEVISCPPDEKKPDYWCGWRFRFKNAKNFE
ncbi:MAG: DUF6125 family protein [Nitrososphaeria archaeon]